MTPDQLRRLAEKVGTRYPAPYANQQVNEHIRNDVFAFLAEALLQIAAEDTPDTVPCRAIPYPGVQELRGLSCSLPADPPHDEHRAYRKRDGVLIASWTAKSATVYPAGRPGSRTPFTYDFPVADPM